MILVKFDNNYADEFDTHGFSIMTQYEFDSYIASAKQAFINAASADLSDSDWKIWCDTSVEVYFGTNEQWSWIDYEDFISETKCEQISIEAMKYIVTNIGSEYGMFPDLEGY